MNSIKIGAELIEPYLKKLENFGVFLILKEMLKIEPK